MSIHKVYFLLLITPISFQSLSAQNGSKKESLQEGIVQFSIGGNLNFIEDKLLDGLYYDIYASQPAKWGKFGIDARLNQGRLVNQNDTSNVLTIYQAIRNDTLNLLEQRFRSAESEQQSYLSLSIDPTYELCDGLFAVAHFEYFRQTIDSRLGFIVESQDTIPFSSDLRVSSPNTSLTPRNIRRINHYFNYSIGIKLQFKIENVTVNIKPTLGVGQLTGSPVTSAFYFTRFEAIENKLGFKIGGEIRGYIGGESTVPLSKPLVNIYAAKTFSLSKLGETLFGGN